MHFPTWVDLKGQDTVPETVHHVVLDVCVCVCACVRDVCDILFVIILIV